MTIDSPDRLDLASMDIAADRIALLREDFPEIFRDGKIDFESLRRSLGDWIEPENERFGLQWPGKAEAMRAIQTPSVATLRPDPEGSVDWDTTQNLIIEGDNLEVLKLLQKSYYGKVKMIYIDPPYNTGNDFVYPDNYREGLQSYLEYTGQVDADGRKNSTNTETSGRYHSNWLNMMYPRLFLARNLLREDGVIFVSIDDHELANLRALLNDVFGEENFIANAVWQKKYSVSNDDPGIAPMHDHILIYSRSESFRRGLLPRTEKHDARYTNQDSDPRGPWASAEYVSGKSKTERPTLWYSIEHPTTGEAVWPDELAVWRYTKEKHDQNVIEGRVYWGPNQTYKKPRLKRYLKEIQQGIVPSTWWPFTEVGHNDQGQKETAAIIGRKVFDTPKPVSLISRMLQISSSNNEDQIILDFFAGSGTTGHAVMKQNVEDGGNRRYILVQLPEPIDPPKTLDDGTTLSTISDITRERIRRAGKQIAQEAKKTPERVNGEAGANMEFARTKSSSMFAPQEKDSPVRANSMFALAPPRVDIGFRSYKLDTSNFKPWSGSLPTPAQGTLGFVEQRAKQIALQLQDATNNVVAGRSAEDILIEIILKLGFELTVPVARLTLAGKEVFAVNGGEVLICLNPSLTLDVIEAMADENPGQIICLDSGFNDNDELKVNASQIIKSKARSEESTIAFKVV